MVRWPQLLDYFSALAAASDRLRVDVLGPASLGQPLVLLTISSPANLARLPDLREIQRRLADPRLRDAGEVDGLVAEGRCVCLITCAIHATEVGSAQMAPELVHRLITAEDETTRRVRDEVVLLLMPSLNPDGLELVADWYERTLGSEHEGSVPPEIYHPFAGHDNNRDWFMQTQIETRLTVSEVHRPWRPQIVLDLHQMQSNGPRYVLPPFVDPYDPNVDPILQAEANALGSSVAADMVASGKTGVATSVFFDAFSPSRAYSHYHGGVRILAEAASARIATPIWLTPEQLVETRGFDPRLGTQNHPAPWPGGVWSLRDIVDYHLAASLATLDHAARFRERWLRAYAAVHERAVARRRPFAFLVPPLARQRDPRTAGDLLDLLRAGDVEIHEAAAPFTADRVEMPAGTFVVPLAQPSGAFAQTLLEVQHYPPLRLYPGGPPRPPYDITAHTLPLQMGVDAVRVDEPFEAETIGLPASIDVNGGLGAEATHARRFVIGAEANASVTLVNRVLAAGSRVWRCSAPFETDGGTAAAGAFVVDGIDADRIGALAGELGVSVADGDAVPTDRLAALRAPRIGLYRSWRPNAIDEGWTRFVLDQHGFSVRTLRDRDIRQGNLRASLDALVLPQQSARDILDGNPATDYPAEFAGGIGDAGGANLRRFVEEGGALIALDSACEVAIKHLYLPVTNVLEGVRTDQFYAPGSMLRLLVDTDHPLGWGLPRESVAMFVSSPAFDVRPAAGPEPRVVARYPLANPLLSGWILGGHLVAGKAALVDAPLGRGRAILFGFRPQFRAQTKGTFRLLFNALYRSSMEGGGTPVAAPRRGVGR